MNATNKQLKVLTTKKDYEYSFDILGFEPYFNDFVVVGTINHNTKRIRPTHGYFYPHKYGKRMKAMAKKLNYTF